jgi:hypothetical protein
MIIQKVFIWSARCSVNTSENKFKKKRRKCLGKKGRREKCRREGIEIGTELSRRMIIKLLRAENIMVLYMGYPIASPSGLSSSLKMGDNFQMLDQERHLT